MRTTRGGDESFGAIRELIRARLEEQALPALAVAVARDGEILWEEAFGWADRENRVRATEHTMFSLASISKPITATALMLLKEQEKLDLDRPINDYLGEAKLTARVGDAADATVRRVANHTAGLPLHWHFFHEDEPSPPPRDETIRRYGNLITAPGERYQYSNLGYGILDHVVSRLSGRSYADFMREAVFLPLGMTRASIQIGPGLEAHAAARYGSDGLRLPHYDFDHPGGSAVYCSTHDLVRFGMFHLKARLPDQKAILSDAALDEMQVATTRTDASLPERSRGTAGYGVGWGTNEDRHGYRTVSHGGGMAGVSTTLELVPAEKLAMVVLANASCRLPHEVADEIFAVLLPGYAERRAEKQARDEAEKEKPQEPKPDFAPPPELLGEWTGAVHTPEGEIPLTLDFKPSGDVHAHLGDQLKTLLNEVDLKEDRLTGCMTGRLGTEDTDRRPYHLHAFLQRRGDRLNGSLTAISLPAPRSGFALNHWTELRKGGG